MIKFFLDISDEDSQEEIDFALEDGLIKSTSSKSGNNVNVIEMPTPEDPVGVS